MLFPGEKLYDTPDEFFRDHPQKDADALIVNGERRILAARPPSASSPSVSSFSVPFSSVIQPRPRSEWSAALKEQAAMKGRVSDLCNFAPNDQDGLPTCWSQGPAQAATVMRLKMGLPFKRISACSTAVPISGGHQGGWEGDALAYAAKHGWATVDEWPENNTNRSLNNDPRVVASRPKHKALKWLEMQSFADWVEACLMQLPGAFAYNWMSHVMMSADIVEIERDSFGFRPRNSWGDWGAKNDLGFYGFATYREGHGTPNSGFVLYSMTSSLD